MFQMQIALPAIKGHVRLASGASPRALFSTYRHRAQAIHHVSVLRPIPRKLLQQLLQTYGRMIDLRLPPGHE
eukprot:3199793-Ditylum_brightwellii.AAC.1